MSRAANAIGSTGSVVAKRPWEHIPNPFGFPTLSEQAQQVFYAPPTFVRHFQNTQQQKYPQRTAPLGRDWLGRGFRKGDTLLATVSGESEFVVVDEVFLDDPKGQPYKAGHSLLVLDTGRREVFSYSYDWNSRDFTLYPVDGDWLGIHLGLFTRGETPKGLDSNFVELELQGFRVRCKPLAGDGKKRSLTQAQVTVLNEVPDRELLENYLAAIRLPKSDQGIAIPRLKS